MIKSFIVKNFKNIEEMCLPRLKRVNLIVGKNSVGKSSLLEALAIYLSNGEDAVIRSILYDRGEGFVERRDDADYALLRKNHYLSLFRNWNENYSRDFKIVLGENLKDAVRLSQVYIQEYRDESNSSLHKMQTFTEEDLSNSEYGISAFGQGIIVEKNNIVNIIRYDGIGNITNKVTQKFQMVRSFEFDNINNAQLYDKISLSSDEQYVVQILNVINPDIERLAFVSDNSRDNIRIPMVAMKSSNRRVRLSTMGDGMCRILTVILSLLNAKDGILLLDEFETGLHYSVQKQLWEIIFILAGKLNVQVFVTTHSSDCLYSFAQTNNEGNGLLIRLEQRKTGIVPVCYEDNSDILFASEHNVELR